LWSAIDVIAGAGDGHNLLPFEWLIYGFYGALTVLGCGIGRVIRRAARQRAASDEAQL
jgi:hypothetical protein